MRNSIVFLILLSANNIFGQNPNLDSLIKFGEQFEFQGNFNQAIDYYNKAFNSVTSEHQQAGEILSRIGYVYYANKDFERSVHFYKRACENYNLDTTMINPDYPSCLFNIGMISFYHLGQGKDTLHKYATRSLEKARLIFDEDSPNIGKYYGLNGLGYWSQGKYQDATEHFLTGYNLVHGSLEFSNEEMQICNYLGVSYQSLLKFDSSIYYFTQKLIACKRAM